MKAKLLKKLRQQSIKTYRIEADFYECNGKICKAYNIVYNKYTVAERLLRSVEQAICSLRNYRRQYILRELVQLKQIKMQKYLNKL